LVVYLQAWQLIPEDRLAELMSDVFGLEVATATVAAMGHRKAQELAGLAAHIEQEVKHAAVKHLAETDYRIAGGLHWLHVASTCLLTSYRTSAKRGAMLAGVRGIIVHDFWRSYLTMVGVLHALRNAHHLRELKALMDIEKELWARAMYRLLRQACHAAHLAHTQQRSLSPRFLAWLSVRSDRILAQGFAFHESQPPLGAGLPMPRGRIRRRTGHNLLIRLRDHKEDTLRFLHDPIVPFTNNQAERDLRMMKVRQKISGGFRSETGAQTFTTLRTVLSTARKQGWNSLATLTTPPAILTQNLRTA
jgi:transposase